MATESSIGVTAIDTNSGGVTVIVVLLFTAPSAAVIFAVPSETALAIPLASILAMPVSEEVHVTVLL